MTAGDDIRARPSDPPAGQTVAAARPFLVTASPLTAGTGLILFPQPGSLPAAWAGPVPAGGLEPAEVAALQAAVRPCPMLPEHGAGWPATRSPGSRSAGARWAGSAWPSRPSVH